ncbi:Ig-like domain-containing protein [Bacillus solitudinis]|uniref:Ig-like domain-containing protein n=1 Tax=Bacillus solitudinis TaxID=2014074 RepID=UPI000C248773|nr:Ig-like domain-containing protein [Bacillus solitudinis]
MSYQPKSYRKFLATSLSAAIVASAVAVPVSANEVTASASFTDVSSDFWANAEISYLVDKGIIDGYPDGTFKPGLTIIRGQAAALLATAARLDVPETVTEAPFNDLTVDSYFAPVAEVMKEVGYIKGYTDGTFGAGNPITREQMASVLVRTFGLEDLGEEVTVTDLDTVSPSHKANVEILAQYGITSTDDNSFRPKESVTRAQFATFLTRTLTYLATVEAGLTGLEFVDGNTVEVSFDKVITAAELEEMEFAFSPELEVTGKALKETEVSSSAEGSTVVLTTADQEVDTEYTLVLDGEVTVLSGEGKPVPEVVDLAVNSVSASNNKEITIKFNKEVETATAEDADNYELSNAALGAVTAKLADDKQTVTLTVATAAAQQAKTDVTVKNVKDTDGAAVAETTESVTFFDTTTPTANSVKVVGPKTLEVEFSEPLQTAPTFVLNGGSYSVSPTFTSGDKKVTLTLGGTLPEATHTLTVSGGSDYSSATGFAVEKTDLDFTYAVDKVAPTVEVYKSTEQVVTLKFSKAVKATNLNADVTAYHTLNNQSSYKGTLAAVDAVNGYSDTFTVTFSTPIAPGAGKTLFLNTKENKLEDLWGNDVESTSLSFDLVSDVVAASVTKVEATGKNATAQKEITVTFDEEVVKADAENKANYILKDANGNVVKTADFADVDTNGKFNNNASIVYDNATKTAKITLTNALDAAGYQLTVQNIKDKSFNSNKLTSQTLGFSVEDKIRPSVGATTVVDTNTLYVDFSEAMSSTGLATASNYEFVTNGSLPTNTKVEVVTNKRVKITLPNGHGLTGTDTVRVDGSLTDLAGNSIGSFYGDSTNTFTFGTPTAFTLTPAADQVKLVAANQLQFEVGTELSAVTAADFTLTATGADLGVGVSSVTYVNNNGKATVTVTLDAALSTSDLSTITSLAIADGGLTNSLGTAISGGPTTFVEASGHFEDKLAAKVTGVETTATNKITITFSEGIPAGEIANATFSVAGNTVASVAHTPDADTVVLTLTDNIDTDATPVVSQTVDIKDANGNVLAAGTATPDTEDSVAASVAGDFTNADTKIVTVNFSETMDADTLVQGNFSSTAGGAITGFTKASDNKSVTITFTTGLVTNNTVDVSSSVTDVAGNASGATLTKN